MTLRTHRARYQPLQIKATFDELSSSDESFKTQETTFKLKREIGLFSGVCLVVGMVIGSGIFVVPTGVLKYCDGDVRTSMVVWGLGGVIAMVASLCVCELGASIPESGSWMTFLHYAYGPFASFVFAWMMVIVASPEGLAAQVIALGEYMTRLHFDGESCELPHASQLKKLLGMLVALVVLAVNITRVRLAVKLQIFCALGKVVALIGISVVGLFQLMKDSTIAKQNFMPDGAAKAMNDSASSQQDSTIPSGVGIAGLSLALYQGLWAYDGFEAVTLVTEEVKNPTRTLPIIMYISIPIITCLYLVVNVAYFSVLTPNEMLASHAVAVTFGQRIHPAMSYLMTISVCMSLIGSINSNFLAVARFPFVAGRLGHMPEILSMVHIHHYSPVPAILLSMGLGVVMLFPSNFDLLVTANLLTVWGFRCLAFVGLLYLRRKRKDLQRPYKVYTVTAAIAIFISGYLILVPLIFQPKLLYVMTIVLLVFFAAIYACVAKGRLKIAGIGGGSIFLQKLLLVAPTTRISYD